MNKLLKTLNLVLAIPKCLQIHEKKIIYQLNATFFYYAVTLTWMTCFDSFLSHLQALFKIQILITNS